ncbi:hypothetical protein JNB_19743 [Janibacter sp. HTCC2649]|nr:hypothetical protein JNB_19743 [Janibacter sp. HTCC2649]
MVGVTVMARPTSAPTGLFVLWMLTGLAGVLALMGMLTIGIFVLPIAIALLVLSIILTERRPNGWPAVAGLGLSLAAGLIWLGWVLATAGPNDISCSGGSDVPTTCTSNGVPIDENAIAWAKAIPWFAAAAAVVLLSCLGYVALRKRVNQVA